VRQYRRLGSLQRCETADAAADLVLIFAHRTIGRWRSSRSADQRSGT
jgi:hypothetical protein